jgi:thiol-disulfide isomerase/thioredoxin
MNKIIYFLLIPIFFSGCMKDEVKIKELVKVGDSVPDFSVMNYHSAQTAGKITLITFFDPECGDCRRERPLLQYVWDDMQEKDDFEMVNISRGWMLENVAAAADGALWLNMPCYPDPDRKIYNLFATSTVPRIYLVDRQGIVCKMWVEKTNLTEEDFLNTIKLYLENP